MKSIFSSLLLLLSVCLCAAGDWTSKGETRAEVRQFTDDDNPITKDTNLGLFARLEARYRNGPWRAIIRGFGRVDHEDDSRDLSAFEEAWLGYRKSGWDIRLGYQLLNWTATEAFHPADIVNSRNLDSNIENPEKLGEPMLSIRKRIGEGGLTLYAMPRYEEPNLPGPSVRLNFLPPGFQVGEPIWLEGDGDVSDDSYGEQWGARFTQTLGDADLSVHYLDHIDRQIPAFAADPTTGIVRPVYFRTTDIGLTYLHVIGAWIAKIEYAHKDFEDQTLPLPGISPFPINQIDHQQAAFGLEYGWNGKSGSETTLIFEGQAVLDTTEEERALINPFQRDLLGGIRHAWNDKLGRELLVTVITDVERDEEYLFNLPYSQRLTDTWSIETGIRWIEAPPKASFPVGLENLHEANQIFVNLSRFF
jgi:hypothetical protein